jgi:hypothetical protein
MYTSTMTVTISKKDAAPFRDIRADLRTRIVRLEEMSNRAQAKFIETQEKAAADHKRAMDSFKAAVANYRQLLELEESFAEVNVLDINDKIGPMPEEVKIQMPVARPALADFFCDKIKHLGPLTKGELRGLAQQAGYFNGDEGGRQTHATLVNIKRTGRVNELEGARFELVEKENASVFE